MTKQTVRLLVVDDEAEIRSMLESNFLLLQYDVRTASNGREALKLMEREQIHIVVTDILMPEMTGDELCAEIRKNFPYTRIIVMTGLISLEKALACHRRGADFCFFKPLEDLVELEVAVAQCVGVIQHWTKLLNGLAESRAMEGRGQ